MHCMYDDICRILGNSLSFLLEVVDKMFLQVVCAKSSAGLYTHIKYIVSVVL